VTKGIPKALQKWNGFPNLRLRPHAPNRGRGKHQIAVRRAFLVHGDEITTAQALDWALPRHRHETWRRRDRWSVIVALRAIADPIRKVPPHGAWLWRLRNGEPE
jgi:hypothetical protein